jgi:type II secretory pathway component GspD/PulD (secretin)
VIIPLQSIDPYFTITLLEEMFELNLPAKLLSKKAIKIDADPAGKRLFVRGPKDKVDEIQKVVEDLDQKDTEETERVVPVFGAKAKSLLEQAESSWRGKNPIRQLDTSYEIETEIIERTVHEEDHQVVEPKQKIKPESKVHINKRPERIDQPIRNGELISARNGTNGTNESRSIEAKITSRGIVLDSDDSGALDSFESHLRSLSDGDESSKVETIIYYLKYCNADEATQLIADLLDGTSSVLESSTQAKLVKGTVPTTKSPIVSASERRSTKNGSAKDGSTLVTSGSLTVIADARLNRLICIGNSSDLKLVEQYLAVIDKDTSLTAIEVHGVSHVIELKHAKAAEIAAVIRDTYGDRVAMNSEQKKAQQTERVANKERGEEGPENKIQTSRNQEPQMSIAVHEVSNSLIVTAPETLYQEIKQLIDRLDQQSEQAVEVIYYPSAEGIEMLRSALQLKGSPIKPRAKSTTPTTPTKSR